MTIFLWKSGDFNFWGKNGLGCTQNDRNWWWLFLWKSGAFNFCPQNGLGCKKMTGGGEGFSFEKVVPSILKSKMKGPLLLKEGKGKNWTRLDLCTPKKKSIWNDGYQKFLNLDHDQVWKINQKKFKKSQSLVKEIAFLNELVCFLNFLIYTKLC